MDFATKSKELNLLQKEARIHRDIERAKVGASIEVRGKESQRPPTWLRILNWMDRQISTPRRIIRFFQWIVSPLRWARVSIFVKAVLGRRVSEKEYDERQKICLGCEFQKDGYCVACGCGRWKFSRLRFKNRLRGHYCPIARHSGTYDRWKLQVLSAKCEACKGASSADLENNGRIQRG